MSEFAPKSPYDQVLGTPLGELKYMVRRDEDNRHSHGVLPAVAKYDAGNDGFRVTYDPETVHAKLYSEYETDQLTRAQLDTLYIGMGVIDAKALEETKELIALGDDEKLQDLWEVLSSPDTMNRRVLEHESDEFQRKILTYLNEELSPAMQRINGLRYAAGVILQSDLELQIIVPDEMVRRLEERIIDDEQSFVPLVRAFVPTIEAARECFAESIPPFEIACSFPMDAQEVEVLSEKLKGKSS